MCKTDDMQSEPQHTPRGRLKRPPKKKKLTSDITSSRKPPVFDAYGFMSVLPEFSTIPAAELKQFASTARLVTLNAGEFIAVEGDEVKSHGFIVVSGRIAMLKSSHSGKELIVELLQSGDIFGLLLMLSRDRLPAQLSAKALQKSTVLWLSFNGFNEMLKTHEDLFKAFVAHLLICLQSSYHLSRGLAHDRVEVRIASILVSLALKFTKTDPRLEEYTINFTRQQLADLTGTTPETAIRVTRAMQREQLIEIARPGVIKILNLSALQSLAEGDD
jgi:CRP-like cAMP-binding protein